MTKNAILIFLMITVMLSCTGCSSSESKDICKGHSPHRLFTHKGVAYVSAANEKPGLGFSLVAIDIDRLKVIGEQFLPGMVSAVAAKDNDVYLGINSGGPTHYGKYAQILKINLRKDSLIMSNILKAKEELPPLGTL